MQQGCALARAWAPGATHGAQLAEAEGRAAMVPSCVLLFHAYSGTCGGSWEHAVYEEAAVLLSVMAL